MFRVWVRVFVAEKPDPEDGLGPLKLTSVQLGETFALYAMMN